MISAEKIPNNVGLSSNKRLQRALEHWQPKYIQWWKDMGPQGFQDYHQVYVRTAVSVDPSGWALFEYVKLPEYRWGIILADPVHDRRIGFGDFAGHPVWQEVPGEFRNQLRRLIVTQGDTEPASVEQQRWLGQRCPSLYDLRNLFQVNVEEGRHLWAMVYLLHSYFGRDGRDLVTLDLAVDLFRGDAGDLVALDLPLDVFGLDDHAAGRRDALRNARLLARERHHCISAVTGHQRSGEAAATVAEDRLTVEA